MNWTDFLHWTWWNNVGNSLLGVTIVGGAVKLFLDRLIKNVPAMKSNSLMELVCGVTNSIVETVQTLKSGNTDNSKATKPNDPSLTP